MGSRLDIVSNALQNEFVVRAVEDGQSVGYIDYKLYEQGIVIRHVFIDENYRRRGYASKLVLFVVEQAEQLGLRLYTGRLTTPGRRLLEGMRDRGLIALEEASRSFFEYEVRKVPVEVEYG